jgi:GNAT superfamily N-acetyltransferase
MSGELVIANALDDDLADWVAVRNRVDVRAPSDVAEMVFFTAFEKGRVNLLARLDGRPVGAALAGHYQGAPDVPFGECLVRVPREDRRRGVGSALYAAGLRHLRELGKDAVQTWSYEDDPDGLSFARKRGFSEISRSQTVVLDLERFVPEGRAAPPGIELTDLAERPELLRAMWELDCEVIQDIPGPDSETGTPWDRFQTMFDKPGAKPSLIVLAMAGEELAGMAILMPTSADPTRAQHWLTGVRRAYRGRGVASALKDRQLTRAKELGLRFARTANEVRNAPIRRLNERLGYVREPDQIYLRAPLPPVE